MAYCVRKCPPGSGKEFSHGGNTGSNPVGDASFINHYISIAYLMVKGILHLGPPPIKPNTKKLVIFVRSCYIEDTAGSWSAANRPRAEEPDSGRRCIYSVEPHPQAIQNGRRPSPRPPSQAHRNPRSAWLFLCLAARLELEQ